MPVVIPTLSASRFLLNTEDHIYECISYIIKWYLSVPKSMTELFRDESVAFQYQIAQYGSSVDMLAEACTKDLTNVFKRIFPDCGLTVNFEPTLVDPDAGAIVTTGYTRHDYAISCTITVTRNGMLYNWNQGVKFDADDNIIFTVP